VRGRSGIALKASRQVHELGTNTVYQRLFKKHGIVVSIINTFSISIKNSKKYLGKRLSCNQNRKIFATQKNMGRFKKRNLLEATKFEIMPSGITSYCIHIQPAKIHPSSSFWKTGWKDAIYTQLISRENSVLKRVQNQWHPTDSKTESLSTFSMKTMFTFCSLQTRLSGS
jgi:hypothetical protein